MTHAAPVLFGAADPNASYVVRPGGYVVLVNSEQAVAVVETEAGLFLPGGGSLRAESAEQTAVRETSEECGLKVRILSKLGDAHEYIFDEREGVHYRKEGVFFLAEIVSPEGIAERGGRMCWRPAAEVALTLKQLSHRWAVQQTLPNLAVNTDAPSAALRARHGSPVTLVR